MPKRGVGFWSVFSAFDMVTRTRETGDASNITVHIAQDGGNAVVASQSVALFEIGLLPGPVASGRYNIWITPEEADCNTLVVMPNSATANILCEDAEYLMDDPSGTYTITFTITDADTGAPLVDCSVEIWNAAENVIYMKERTNGSGQVSVALWSGTYHILLAKLGYTFTVPEVLTVTAAASVAYTGEDVSGASAPSGTQVLRGYLTLNSLSGATGSKIRAEIADKNTLVDHAVLSSLKTEDTVAANGLFELILAQGVVFNITAVDTTNKVFYAKKLTITTDATAWIDDYE